MTNATLSNDNTVIFTVINGQYVRLGRTWAEHVRRACGAEPLFVCSDPESYDELRGSGFECDGEFVSTRYSGSKQSFWRKRLWRKSGFSNDNATRTNSLKLPAALKYLDRDRNVIFSDADAFWLSDPFAEINQAEFDFAFQPGSFPSDVKAAWGFSICMGFFALKSTAAVKRLCAQAIAAFRGDDQLCVNRILLRRYDISWEESPAGWEHCRLDDGWVNAIAGTCSRTNMRLRALPHSLFQRHGTTRDSVKHAIICHPNSPKSEAEKLEVFRSLSVPLFGS